MPVEEYKNNTPEDVAFFAHYVENWNWLLCHAGIKRFNERPENYRYWVWLWPIYTSAAVWSMLGSAAFNVIEHYRFCGLNCQTVLLRNFGWQFFIPQYRRTIRRRILDTVLQIQDGVRVIGLGALIKDESLTRGGKLIVEHLGAQLKVPLVHGDTLTAATVTEQVLLLRQQMGVAASDSVMITGATSKIGRAVVLSLAQRGIPVKLYTGNKRRFAAIRDEAGVNGRFLEWAPSLEGGHDCLLWVTGKSIPKGKYLLSAVPVGASILNFAVPNPISRADVKTRRDLSVYEGGSLSFDQSKTNWRITRLPRGLIYACHAGAIVHAANNWTHHEIGPVDMDQIGNVWRSALGLGFSLPPLTERSILIQVGIRLAQ